MNYIYNLTLDLNTNIPYSVVPAKQGDTGSRLVRVKLTENGNDYTIPSGSIIYFRCRKPDGKAVLGGAFQEDDNTVLVELTEQTLVVAGRAYADIVLCNDNNEVLSTVSFILNIMSAPSVMSNVASSNEFSELNNLINDASGVITQAQQWAIGPVITTYELQLSGTWKVGDTIHILDETFTIEGSEEAELTSAAVGETIYNRFVANPPEDYTVEPGTSEVVEESEGTIIKVTEIDYSKVDFIGKTVNVTQPNFYYTSGTGSIKCVSSTGEQPSAQNNSRYYSQQAASIYSSFQSISAIASTLDPGTSAYASFNATGATPTFEFGIPKGDMGPVPAISTAIAVETLSAEASAYASITGTGASGDLLTFSFGIPKGYDGTGAVSSVDGLGPDSNHNVQLGAVRYNSVQSLSTSQQTTARQNIGATFSNLMPANPTTDYVISYDSNSIPYWRSTREVPSNSSNDSGKLLQANADGTYNWQTIVVRSVPDDGVSGQVLIAGDSSGSYGWGEIAAYSTSEIEELFNS